MTDIEKKLKEFDENVFYGIADNALNETIWDCIVFGRKTVKHSVNKTSASDYFDVLIIRENYIPEDFDTKIIEALCTLSGVKLSGENCVFDYVMKPNTNTVVEMLTIPFVRARKRDVV